MCDTDSRAIPERGLVPAGMQWQKLMLIVMGALFCCLPALAEESTVVKSPASQTAGRGPLPYNYRVIDGRLHAGGSPFNPRYTNSDRETMAILSFLKKSGVRLVLTVDSNPRAQRRLVPMLQEAGLEQLFIPMHAEKVPAEKETRRILEEFRKGGVYVHCTWGADRTGVVIGRYLIDQRGYSKRKAWEAVISGGSHCGPWGGFKRKPAYKNLLLWLWPEVRQEAPDVAAKYGL